MQFVFITIQYTTFHLRKKSYKVLQAKLLLSHAKNSVEAGFFPHQKLVFPATELRELVLSVRETGFPFPLEPVLAQSQQEGNSYAIFLLRPNPKSLTRG
jgi:hypothetical protein